MSPAKRQKTSAKPSSGDKLTELLAQGKSDRKWLVFGAKTGWIGGKVFDLLTERGETAIKAETRLQNREAVEKELDSVQPTHVLNCAGVTGRPNVDWCEDHKPETVRANVIGTLTLADLCFLKKIHLSTYATGCIYGYDEKRALGNGVGFTETDAPNFTGSYYSLTKGMVENLMESAYGANTLTLRFRMPISDDLHHRNFVTKISKYQYVVNIPNSMTVLYDMLPLALIMAIRKTVGVVNFTNPGVISHNEILDMYKKIIDPKFTYENFSLEDQAKVLKADRSNNELDSSKLLKLNSDVEVLPIHEAVEASFHRMAKAFKAEGNFPPKRGPKGS